MTRTLTCALVLGMALAQPVAVSTEPNDLEPRDVRVVEASMGVLVTWAPPESLSLTAGVTYVVHGRTGTHEEPLLETEATLAAVERGFEEYGVAVMVDGDMGRVVYAQCRFWITPGNVNHNCL